MLQKSQKDPLKIRKYALYGAVLFTLLIVVLLQLDIRNNYFAYIIIWLLGLGIIIISYLRLIKSDKKHRAAEVELFELNSELEEKVELRSRELQKSQRDWENIFNTLGTPAQLINSDFTIKYVNEATLTFFNTTSSDIIGKKCHSLFHDKNTPPEFCPLIKSHSKNAPARSEIKFETQDKSFIVNCSPIFDDNGNIEYFMHVMTDISAKKEAELQIKTIIEQAGDAIYISDFDGNIMEINQQAIKEIGYSRKEFMKLKVWELDEVYPDLDALQAFWNSMKQYEPITFETVHKRKNGSSFPVELRVSLTEIVGKKTIMGFARNISERKKTEDELTKYREQLEELVKNRTDELETKNSELERINKLFVGRELRMKELKKEIEKLKAEKRNG